MADTTTPAPVDVGINVPPAEPVVIPDVATQPHPTAGSALPSGGAV